MSPVAGRWEIDRKSREYEDRAASAEVRERYLRLLDGLEKKYVCEQ